MPKELFRTRIDTPLDRKALNFISSLKEDLWIAEIDILGTEVHDIMLFEQNLLNKSEIKKILTSLEEIREKLLANQIEFNEDFEDIHPFIEQSVI